MKLIECTECGSKKLVEKDDHLICEYCRLEFIPQSADVASSETVISVYEDVQKLLEKCKNDPANSKRFASLILDIDPTNAEAKRYLR